LLWDNLFRVARPSQVGPLPLPLGDPTASPQITVSFACEYLPYIRGALAGLEQAVIWNTQNEAAISLVQSRIATLISLFTECSEPPAISCPFDFSLSGSGDDAFVNQVLSAYSPGFLGTHLDGTGWVNTLAIHSGGIRAVEGLIINKDLSGLKSIDALTFTYNVVYGDRSSIFPATGLYAQDGGSVEQFLSFDPSTDTDGIHTLSWSGGPINVDNFQFDLRCGEVASSTDPGGTIQLLEWGYNVVGGGC